ncbi:MAG: HAD-IIB family hydrolase [Lachnospiraceae bacterium]|nr:HAD-IIB family hydrolase [Lachnospiraceae bacterium]
MTVRLIALDLDKTALKAHRELTERTRQAILKALAAGILVVPATGRSYRDIPEAVRSLPGISYFLTSNGANILDGAGQESIYRDLIPWEQGARALRILETYDVQPSVHINGNSVNLKTADPRIVARYGNTDYFKRSSVENLADYVEEQRTDVEKIFAVLFDRKVKTELTARITSELPLAVSASGSDNVELNSLTASKGHGLSMLCARLGIGAEETAVIGDSINDISMFTFAACSVAMGNAENCLKELARYETDTCECDGAAKALERLTSGEWR